jgi:glycosyltransferase involved in cell wall biosynthesis
MKYRPARAADDAAAIAKALIRLAEDRALAARLGEQARAHAHLTFGMERMVGGTEALYAQALGMESA